MNQEPVACKKCGLVDDYYTAPNGPHIAAKCNGCDSHIKFLPKYEATAFYKGKYAGQPIAQLTDWSYLRWALNEPKMGVTTSLRFAIENRLKALGK